VALASTVFVEDIVAILLPVLNSIPELIPAKFFNTLSVSLDSFIHFSII
jgi:hypothetical protein